MEKIEWEKLPTEKQNLYLTLLWTDGYSEGAIAAFLNTTKGRIVRRRQTGLKLPTKGRPPSKARVDQEHFRDLLDLHAMEKLEEEGISSIAPPADPVPLLLQAKGESGCEWPLPDDTRLKPKRCGKPVVPGHRVCEEHLAEALGKK